MPLFHIKFVLAETFVARLPGCGLEGIAGDWSFSISMEAEPFVKPVALAVTVTS